MAKREQSTRQRTRRTRFHGNGSGGKCLVRFFKPRDRMGWQRIPEVHLHRKKSLSDLSDGERQPCMARRGRWSATVHSGTIPHDALERPKFARTSLGHGRNRHRGSLGEWIFGNCPCEG